MTTNAKAARPFAWGVLIAAQAAISIIAITAVADMPTRLVWNVSESVPTGLYAVRDDDHLRPGILAAVMPPEPLASWLVEAGYIGRGAPLLKRVEALPGQRVCRIGARVTVDGELRAIAREADRFGRPLPHWSGCSVISDGQMFLLNTDHPGSLDGRYFGPLPRTSVLGRAVPLLVDEAR
jgi:conjugative transfer signal peptidase TraF